MKMGGGTATVNFPEHTGELSGIGKQSATGEGLLFTLVSSVIGWDVNEHA